MRRVIVCLCAWAVGSAMASLASAKTFGWEETHCDGSPIGRLFLKGHPLDHVYITDESNHPVVVDGEGWYVYSTRTYQNNSVASLRGGDRRRPLWYPTDHRVTPNSRPPRHLQEEIEEVTARSFPVESGLVRRAATNAVVCVQTTLPSLAVRQIRLV